MSSPATPQFEKLYEQERALAIKDPEYGKIIDGKTGALKTDACLMTKIVTGEFRKVWYIPTDAQDFVPAFRRGEFIILGNRRDNDDAFADSQAAGRASMAGPVTAVPGVLKCDVKKIDGSPAFDPMDKTPYEVGRHLFVCPGVEGMKDGVRSINAACLPIDWRSVQRVEKMMAIGYAVAEKWWNIKEQVGLYFHLHNSASMCHLHLHVVDLTHIGPSFFAQTHKNMPAAMVLEWLKRQCLRAKRLGFGQDNYPTTSIGQKLQFDADKTPGGILIIGMGGGADVVAAYALAEQVSVLNPTIPVLTATSIGPRPLPDCVPLSTHLFKLPPTVIPVDGNANMHGTIKLELSIPRRAPRGDPFLLVVDDDKNQNDERAFSLAEQVANLGCNVIIGIDLGGDSVTGGVENGRDRQVARVLHLLKAKFDQTVYHLALGLCADGESSVEEMLQHADKFEGCFFLYGNHPTGFSPFNDVFERSMRELSKTLSPNRTPGIIQAAVDHHNQSGCVDDEAWSWVQLPRGKRACVPIMWLACAYILRV